MLYKEWKKTKEQLKELCNDNKITKEEKETYEKVSKLIYGQCLTCPSNDGLPHGECYSCDD